MDRIAVRFALAILAATALVGGCSLFVDAGGLSTASESIPPDGDAIDRDSGSPSPSPNDDGGSSIDSGGDASSNPDAADGGCPGTAGPTMVRVTDSHGTFCIDSTEVTNKQLNAFILSLTRPTPPAVCSFKATYGGAMRADNNLPAVQVDWCDAWMYCAWAGKRLCGSRNGTVIDDLGPANDPKVSEWFAACSRSGTRQYPYAGALDPDRCNGCQRTSSCSDGGSPVLAVGVLTTCVGGFDGIFDMSGNVAEWEDNCDANNTCPPRGGTANSGGADLACAASGTLPGISKRDEKGTRFGMRCCAD